jgi:hypothetical protein
MNKVTYHEVCQTCHEDLPGVAQHTIYQTNDENEDGLW